MSKPICGNGDFYVIASTESKSRFNVTHRHTLIPAIKWLPRAAAVECCAAIAELGLYGQTVAEMSVSAGWQPAMNLIKEKYMPLSKRPQELPL